MNEMMMLAIIVGAATAVAVSLFVVAYATVTMQRVRRSTHSRNIVRKYSALNLKLR